MGILKDEAARLMRTKWKSAQTLAEEIFAILNSDKPLQIDGPVTINNTTAAPSITVKQANNNDQVMNVVKQPLPTPTLPGIPPLPAPPAGQRSVMVIYADGTTGYAPFPQGTITPGQSSKETPEPEKRQSGGGGFPGTVVSGSGSAYQVRITTPEGSKTVAVTQVQIATGATIPAGTGAVVVQVGEAYYMQVPVWL